MSELEEKRAQLAREILQLSRNQLLANLRFLDAALSRLELTELDGIPFATDGRELAYDPGHVLKCYKTDRAIPVRDYLHALLHCIYRHMFVHTLVDHPTWDLACDIAAEYTISGLGLKAANAGRDAVQQEICRELERQSGLLLRRSFTAIISTGSCRRKSLLICAGFSMQMITASGT